MSKIESDIGEIVTKALSSTEVRKDIELWRDISEECVQRIIEYSVITRSSEIPKELLNSMSKNIDGGLIIKSVAKLLGIDEANVDEHGDEIFEFIYNNLIADGVVYHMTNSVTADKIKKYGLKPVGNTEISDEIRDVARRMESYNWKIKQYLFPYVSDEIKNGTGFYYSERPTNVGAYFYSPEWLKVFCSGAAELAEKREPRHGQVFAERNYESAIENINILIEKYDIKKEDADILINFFNKYWNEFEKATPTLVLIPQKNLDDNSLFHNEYFIERCKEIREGYVDTSYSNMELRIMQRSEEDKEKIERQKKLQTEKEKEEHSSILYKVNELLGVYASLTNGSRQSESVVEPESLSFADMSELVQKEGYMFTLKPTKDSGMINLEQIAKQALKEMGVTRDETFEAQYIEDINEKGKGELQIDDK